jgi:hypothetical protein
MSIPAFDVLNKNIVEWFKKEFDTAMLPYHVFKEKFDRKHVRILHFNKIWKENDYWLVQVVIEYVIEQSKLSTITFQVNEDGIIVGYDMTKAET